jgi:hypothetical protein
MIVQHTAEMAFAKHNTQKDNKPSQQSPHLQSAAEAGRFAALAHVLGDHAQNNVPLITAHHNTCCSSQTAPECELDQNTPAQTRTFD